MDNDKTKVIMGLIVASLREKIGDSSGNIVGAMEKALENPIRGLRSTKGKGAEGA